MQVYPVFLPLKGCPFRCIYCDQHLITAVDSFNLDIHLPDIANFCHRHKDKLKEIAFFGGTFTALSRSWQEEQFQKLAEYIDDKTGIRYSTRPDCLSQEDIDLAKKYGVTTIELGVQDFSDQVLKESRRAYKQEIAIEACKLVKRNKLNLGIQIMPGLPGYNQQSNAETKEIIKAIKPEFVRIYPTLVLRGTELANLYYSGDFEALSLDEALAICADLYEYFTALDIKVIKVGVQIDSLDSDAIIAGPFHKAFGELVQAHLIAKGLIRLIDREAKEVEILINNRYLSKLVGHNNYGLSLIQKAMPDKIFNLRVDTEVESVKFRVISR